LDSHAAIVGSANASSNGLPEEDFKATGLIEAGVYLDDPATLAEIQTWFHELYSVRACKIKASDLKKARLARQLALKNGGAGEEVVQKDLAGTGQDGSCVKGRSANLFCHISGAVLSKFKPECEIISSRQYKRNAAMLKLERKDLKN